MTDPEAAARVRESLTQVRTAYRLLQAYHRRLFDLLDLLRDELSQRVGKLEPLWWQPSVRDRTPEGKTDPLTRWVLDFEPLSHAYFCWTSTRTPSPGSYFIGAHHVGDNVLDATFDEEPDPGKFSPVDSTKTTLSVYFRAIVDVQAPQAVSTWEQAYARIKDHQVNDDDPRWEDHACHTVAGKGVTVRFGGFTCDMADLATREAIEQNLVEPLVRLLQAALPALGRGTAVLPDTK